MSDPQYPQDPATGPAAAPPSDPAWGQQTWEAPGGQQQPGWAPQPGSYPAPPPAWSPPGGGYVGAPGGYPVGPAGLVLPPGTELASVGRRIGAYFLAIPLVIVTLGIGYLIWGLVVWGRGQTPALQVLGMRVYRPDDNKVAGFWWMALREIIGRAVDAVLSFISYLVSFILFCARDDHKSLHDLVAGTVVLYDPDKVLAKR